MVLIKTYNKIRVLRPVCCHLAPLLFKEALLTVAQIQNTLAGGLPSTLCTLDMNFRVSQNVKKACRVSVSLEFRHLCFFSFLTSTIKVVHFAPATLVNYLGGSGTTSKSCWQCVLFLVQGLIYCRIIKRLSRLNNTGCMRKRLSSSYSNKEKKKMLQTEQ